MSLLISRSASDAAVACELARFSRQHQILIFTCHPETAGLFAEVAPETKIIRMERYGEEPDRWLARVRDAATTPN